MTTEGFDQLYVETHNWGKAVAFWEALGYKLEFETDHHSGQLVGPNGTHVFVAEQAPLEPLGMDLSLSVDPTVTGTPPGLEVVSDWTATHWGTRVLTVRDPDGRLFRLQAPVES